MEFQHVTQSVDCLLVLFDGSINSFLEGEAIGGPAEVGGGGVDAWEQGVGGGCSCPDDCVVGGVQVEQACLTQ